MPFLNTTRRRALSQLWVSTMVGTAVLLVLQQLGKDWNAGQYQLALRDMDWRFTLDLWLRYLLALWFAVYLAVAYLINEEQASPKAWGLVYDPVQSLAVLIALGSLGFVSQQLDALRWGLHANFMGAFLGMALIALPPIVRYWSAEESGKSRVQHLRFVAAASGIVGVAVPWLVPDMRVSEDNVAPWLFNAALLIIAWITLIGYAVRRPAVADTEEDLRIKAIAEARRGSVQAVKDAGEVAKKAVTDEEKRAKNAIAAEEQRAVAAVQQAKAGKPAG